NERAPTESYTFPTRRSSDLQALVEVLEVLRPLEGQEDRPERRGAQEEPEQRPAAAGARRVDRQRHRPRAGQQDRGVDGAQREVQDRKSTRLNSSHLGISYAV